MANYSAIVNAAYGPYLSIQDGIDAIISSGLYGTDTGLVNITGENYSEDLVVDNQSGIITIISNYPQTLPSLSNLNSGTLVVKNISFGTVVIESGIYTQSYGTITSGNFRGCPLLALDDVGIVSGIYVSGVTTALLTVDASGTTATSLKFTNCGFVYLVSGDYSHSDPLTGKQSKIDIVTTSGVWFKYSYGMEYADYPAIYMSGVPEFYFYRCSFADTLGESGILRVKNSSGQINYSIFASSGYQCIESIDSIVLSSGSCLYDYDSPSHVNPAWVSGIIYNVDPLFTNPATDLRLRIISPCACLGEPLEYVASGNIRNLSVKENHIQFYNHSYGYLAPRPSGMYVIQDMAIFCPSGDHMDQDVDIVINTKHIIDIENVPSFQSMVSNGNSLSYPLDYKIIQREDIPGQVKYYVIPYTIISLEDYLGVGFEKISAIAASGLYKNRNMLMDQDPNPDGIPRYWILEENNQYLKEYSSITHDCLNTYPLFSQAVSGYSVSTLDDVSILNKTSTTMTVQLNNVYEDGIYKSKNVVMDAGSPTLWFESYTNEARVKPLGILSFKDWFYILSKELIEDNGSYSIQIKMNIYDKFARYPFKTTLNNITFPQFIEDGHYQYGNISDMTMDDEEDIMISASGEIFKFRQFYDYALLIRERGSIKGRIILRENYQGIEI